MEKKSFKVRKGLESPLKIFGMEMQYFYIGMAVILIMVIILTGQIISLARDLSQTNVITFMATLVVFLVSIIALKFWFESKSEKKKISFPKKTMIIDNKNILRFLK